MDKKKEYKEWENLASQELKDKNLDSHYWNTPEGIRVKPLYTEDDYLPLQEDQELQCIQIGLGL